MFFPENSSLLCFSYNRILSPIAFGYAQLEMMIYLLRWEDTKIILAHKNQMGMMYQFRILWQNLELERVEKNDEDFLIRLFRAKFE